MLSRLHHMAAFRDVSYLHLLYLFWGYVVPQNKAPCTSCPSCIRWLRSGAQCHGCARSKWTRYM